MIDNSGFLEVVTLNSPSGVCLGGFPPFVNKSSVSNLFSIALKIVGDLFVPPRFACN